MVSKRSEAPKAIQIKESCYVNSKENTKYYGQSSLQDGEMVM
jgi:hypothetical protein